MARRYDFKCPNAHVKEYVFNWDDKPDTLPCHMCDEPARSVIPTTVQQSVDNIDRNAAWSESAGRYFSNRGDVKQYCDQNDLYEISPEESARAAQDLKDTKEAQQDLGSAFYQWDAKRRKERASAQGTQQKYEPAIEAALQQASQDGVDIGASTQFDIRSEPLVIHGTTPEGHLTSTPDPTPAVVMV